MRKLKKSSKNKKPIAVFIYGPIAVGKLTVAKILSKKTGYRLTHNHHVNDFVDTIFDRHTYHSHKMKEFLRFSLLESLVKARVSFVTTHCYRHDFVSKTGLTDPKYIKDIEKKLLKLGAKFCPIFLDASDEELLRRVSRNSRRNFMKLNSKTKLKEILRGREWHTSARLKNNLVIDNTKLSPQKVANMIIKHFKLK